MGALFFITTGAVISQAAFLFFVYLNYRFAIKKFKKEREGYRPRTALIIPCKGIDDEFEKNIQSFYLQDYEDYLLWFVVEDESDAAYIKLLELKTKFRDLSKAKEVRILVAGQAQGCGQKIHNLLYCYRQLPQDIEAVTFADSDAYVRSDGLAR